MARLPVSLLAALVVATPLAGCLAGTNVVTNLPAPTVADLAASFVNPLILEHDHRDLSEHQTSNAVDLVGRDVMGEKGPPGYPGEIDVQGHYAYVALLGYGFGIVDLADPAHPKTVSTTQAVTPNWPVNNLPSKYAADIKVDKTGDWVFLAMELSDTPGLLIYDARDKAHPVFAGAWAEPGKYLGCHMIDYAEIGGQEYVFCAPLDVGIYVGLLSPVLPTGQRTITRVARYTPSLPVAASETGGSMVNEVDSGHDDVTFQLDVLTGKPVLTVSAWNLGIRLVDVSVPAAPMELGAWDGQGAKWYHGQIHTAMTFKSSDGRRIVVAIPEVANPPALFVLDASDFGRIRLLGEWKALENFGRQPYTFSMHNFQIVNQKVYLEMYHGGLWILDLSTPERLTEPVPVGSYMPHEPRADGKAYEPMAWDTVVWHGYTLVAEGNTGLYVLHHAPDPAGDASYTSFA